MKNLYLLPTNKPSRLVKICNDVNRETFTLKLDVEVNDSFKEYVNVYITSDEEIKEGDVVKIPCGVGKVKKLNWKFGNDNPSYIVEDIFIYKLRYGQKEGELQINSFRYEDVKKIILTTDQDLIKDGVQEIDDEFLEWFVKNPSCESVEIIPLRKSSGWYDEKEIWHWDFLAYKIIIPKDEPKQETLEEVAERLYPVSPQKRKIWINGAKWQQERMYSEEEVHDIIESYQNNVENNPKHITYDKWFEQFKKK